MGHIFGLDLGLKTGGFVKRTYDGEGKLFEDTIILADWDNGPNYNRVSVNEATTFVHNKVCPPFLDYASEVEGETCWVAIDWNPNDAFWGNRMASVYKAFIAGYLYRTFASYLASPVFIPPHALRKYLQLEGKASKEQTYAAFERLTGEKLNPSWSTHVKDSVLLAHFLKEIRFGRGQVDGLLYTSMTEPA